MDPSTTPPMVSSPSSPRAPEEPFFEIPFRHKALMKPSEEIRLLQFATAESSIIYAPQLTLEAWSLSDAPPYPWMCGNFRDRVYALIGITTWVGSLPVPDYSLGKFRWLVQILNCLKYEEDEQTPLRNDIGWLVDSVDWKLQDHDAQALLAKRRELSSVISTSLPSHAVTQLRWRPSALSMGYVVQLSDVTNHIMDTTSPRRRTTCSLPELEASEHFRRVQEDGVTVGYVPTSAKGGDVLFAPGQRRVLYLILREAPDENIFCVVGYALYMSRTTSDINSRSGSQPARPPNFRFDPEDALGFALFDLRTWSLHGETQGEIDQALVEYILKQPATRSPMSSYGLRVEPK